MSDKSFIAEYKSIKAPDELFDKIMTDSRPPEKTNIKVYIKTAAGIAAALIITLVSAFALTGNSNAPSIFIGDELLTGEVLITSENADGIMLARAVNELCVNFRIEEKEDISITPKNGFVLDENGEILCEENNTLGISSSSALRWTIPIPDENSIYTMDISDKNGNHTLTLSFDRQTENWTVSLNK